MMKLISKNDWGKKKVLQKRELIDTPCESNIYIYIYIYINIVFEKHVIFWYCNVYGEVPSSSSQIVEQFDVIQEVLLPGISKLNDTVP